MTPRGRAIAIVVVGAIVVIAWVAPYLVTAAFVLDLAGQQPGLRRWIPIRTRAVTTTDVTAPTRFGVIPARIYAPEGAGPTVVLFPGIHGGGVDEPRFARFSSRLSGTGVRVVAVPLPDLREFRVTSRSTDMIEDVTAWAVRDREHVPGGRVGLVGVSFAGGLALVAAGRPSLAGRLSGVVSIGGHGDLGRTLRYLTSGRLPDGSTRAPHDYGIAVAALAAAPLLLAPPTREAFSSAVRTYLEASLDASPDHAQGMALLAQAKAAGMKLPAPEQRVLLAITDRDVVTAGRWIEPAIQSLAADPGLSPEASPASTAPVFLLHGLDDNVIPSTETPLVAKDFERRGNEHVVWLLTPFLTHADVTGDFSWREAWRFLRFWHDVRRVIAIP